MEPQHERLLIGAVAALTLVFATHMFLGGWSSAITAESILEGVEAPEVLKGHTNQFNEPTIVKVSKHIHVAIGFALANSILLHAPEGVIVVDTTESMEAASEVYKAFRKITDKPIKAIIYTHNHADHVQGTKAFLDDPEHPPDIWAHSSLIQETIRYRTVGMSAFVRGMRQFGVFIPKHINSGIGKALRFNEDMTIGYVQPTHTMDGEELELTIAGLQMKLIHIPGETPDQIGIWLPDQKTLLCADDLYRAFPNLYAIRGTPTRDITEWVHSLDKMRDLGADILVPSHTQPVKGHDQIFELITQYRDAIQFVHDQTVRYINKNILPDDIVTKVQLPQSLKSNPYLQELYGTVEWSVKSTFSQYMGWFSGDITDLNPLTAAERSQRVVVLAGGADKAIQAAKSALDKGDIKWALELSSHVFRLDPENTKAKAVRLEAIKLMASKQVSANGRNYYLTMALEDHKLIKNVFSPKVKATAVKSMQMKDIIRSMRLRLKAEEVEGVEKTLIFNLTDTQEVYCLRLRNSIVEINDSEDKFPDKWDFKLTTTDKVWRDIILGERSPLMAYTMGDIVVEGGIKEFSTVMAYFEKD